MKLFTVLLLVAPCILGADIGNIECPDGTVCRKGTTCERSDSTGKFVCTSILDLENQRLFVGPVSSLVLEAPTTTSEGGCDNGTLCDGDRCCPTLKRAICCPNMAQCCPSSTQCCGNATSTQWCCPQLKARCHPDYGLCIAGASSAAPAFALAALAALLAAWMGSR